VVKGLVPLLGGSSFPDCCTVVVSHSFDVRGGNVITKPTTPIVIGASQRPFHLAGFPCLSPQSPTHQNFKVFLAVAAIPFSPPRGAATAQSTTRRPLLPHSPPTKHPLAASSNAPNSRQRSNLLAPGSVNHRLRNQPSCL